ncbi:hypothetical protein HYH03_013148 [Edaphochlamys debaryana]|uniref:MYND-type domain-containing protein n=1 Tax=Edaphochlamys debaryana TaxID=47281 RepID=A0A835XQB8_9CHLO|nr:hypothetical protein HYH03_013148 [Edaphochlamys debaryana]|eukprot:KAG2488298.1 hypothetical protein HYH03_013148 [Edaphochlamys debaryana]
MPPRRNGRAAPGGPQAGPGGRGPPAAATGFSAATVSALPPALISGWLRLPAIAEGLLGPAAGPAGPAGAATGGAAASLVGELQELSASVAGLNPYETGATPAHASLARARSTAVAELCSHGSSTTALMRLLAETLRVPEGEGNAAAATAGGAACLRQAQGAVCEFVGGIFLTMVPLEPGPHALSAMRLLQTVIRAHTLHALSRQLAAAGGRLAGPGGAGGAGGAAPAREALVQGTRLVNVTPALLCAVNIFAFYARDANPARDAEVAPARLLQSQLAAALQSSRVLDHAGRLLVLLLQAGVEAAAAGPGWSEADRRAVSTLRPRYSGLPATLMMSVTTTVGVGQEAAPLASRDVADAITTAISGLCVRHAVTACALGILCAEDGGPAYGLTRPLLPADATAAMAAAAARGGDFSVRTWRGDMGLERATILMSAVWALSGQPRAPLQDWRAAVVVVQRIGRTGLEQAQRLVRFPPAAPSELENKVAMLCLLSLETSHKLLPSPPLPAGWEAEAAEWWRQVLAGGRYVLGSETIAAAKLAWLRGATWLEKAVWPAFLDAQGLLCLPAEPPRDVAAALAAGLLPAAEALLRRVGEDPEGPETDHRFLNIAAAVSGRDGRLPFHVVAALLAYGEPLQAASLVLTVGKALRRWDRSRLERAGSNGGTALNWLVARCEDFLISAVTAGAVPWSLAPGSLSRPQAQLVRVVSLAAAEWLPPLARLGEAALELAAARNRRVVDAGSWLFRIVTSCTRVVATWVSVCSGPCLSQAQAPGAGCSTAGPSAPPSPAVAGGPQHEWLPFLASELWPERLLLGTLEAVRRDVKTGELEQWRSTVAACSNGLVAMWDAVPCTSAAELRARRRHTLDILETSFASGGIVGTEAAALYRQVAAAKASAAGSLLAGAAGQWPAELDAFAGTAAEQARAAVGPLAERLVPPERARREALPRRCGLGPACVNLAGDSEAGLALRPCTGCRAMLFCSRECQRAAMQAGHKEACAGAKGRAG